MNYVWSTATHVGHIRAKNEDSVTPSQDGVDSGPIVIAVADGMGGAVGGEIASRIAINAATATDDVSAGDRVRAANEAVLAAVDRDGDLQGMGTTLTLGVFHPDGSVDLAHVGDSRAYMYRTGELMQLTDDHTVVMEMVRRGQLTDAQAATHPRRHMLSRVIGMKDVAVDERAIEVQDGDRLLLCSDGLTGMVTDSGVSMILRTAPTASDVAWSLVEAANRAGGHDNTTVAVIDVRADG